MQLRDLRNSTYLSPIFTMRDNVMSKLGLFTIKARLKQRLLFKRIQREDVARKRKIGRLIPLLPSNLIDKSTGNGEIIVSVTSYGHRVTGMLPYMLYSLCTQTQIPHKVAVFLDKDNWNDQNLPPLLKEMQRIGVDFYYCEDIRSYKKLIPALKMFPDNPIITVDDDFYYNKQIVEWLSVAYEKSDKKTVIGSWGCVPVIRNGRYAPYTTWPDCKFKKGAAEYSLFAGNGTIYPPNIFDDEICKKEIFMKLCPKADDIWFWIQEKRLGIKIQLIANAGYGLHVPVNRIYVYNPNLQGTLFYENGIQGKNDEQLENLLHYYNME